MYNNVNSGYIKRLLVIIIMMAMVVVGGTFAWFTYQSKEAALVLTIGDINDTQIILTPYQINGVMAPGTTYESGIYSEVTVNKGTTNSTSFALFYKINELDSALIDNGLSYTVTNSQTGDVVKTGKFSDLIDTSKPLPDEVVILDANTDTTLSASTSVYYRVYLWLDSSVTNQNSVANTKLDVELNGSIGSVIIEGNSVYGHKLSTTINDGMIDGNDSYTYQWYSNTTNSTKGGTLIEGATDSTYIVGSGLAGKYIYVVVTSSNGKTLSDITDNTNNYQVDNECDNYNDGRVERETPIITLSSMSGTVEAGPVGGSEENYPNAYNSFTTTINKSQNSVLDTDYAGTLTVVSSNTSNVTIVSGTSTSLTTLGGSNVIKYHGEPSIPAGSNITVTFTPSDTTNVCTISGNYSVNKVDTIEPVQPSVTLTDCDTFTYLTSDVVGITGYYISTVNNKPTKDASACTASNTLNCWTTNTSFSFTANTTAATYYVWAKDAAGNISESSNTQLVKITRTEGEGTTLTTRYNSTSSSSGTVYTDSIYVLKNCPIYSSAVANSGYNAIVLKHNGTSVTTSGTKATITDAFTVESSSTENTATITINKDGVAWSNSGMNVALYSGTTLKYAYNTATASDSTVVWEGVAPGTYNIYAGKSSNAKTELLDSGIDITIGASTSATTAYSATINYYGLTLQKGVGISAVSNGGTSTIDEVAYLRNSSSIQAIAIDATVADGYTWSTWSKVSGTTLSTITAATKSQNIKMAAGAAVYKATSKYTAVPTVTRTNNETNTYTYVTTAGAEYYVSTSTTAPSATAATCEEGTVLNCWAANNTFTIDESTTAAMYYVYVKDAAGSVSSGKAQIYSATPSITVSDYNTFTYTATSAKAYYVTMTDYGNDVPDNAAATSGFALDKWTTTTSTGNLTLSEGTYYVYTKDATAVTGNISPIRASVNAYKITRTQGTGTTLTTKYTSSSGTSFTSDVLVLGGSKIYAKSVITTGYNTATLQYGDTSLTASGQTFVVNGAGAIVSSATANKVTITINENGSAANTTGYSVSLSTSSSSDTATFSGTTNGSTISFESGTANLVSGTTYYIWSGKSSNAKTTRLYSGVTVKGAASVTTAATINYYGLRLVDSNGIASVSNGGVNTTDTVQYLYHPTASSRQTIAIDVALLDGYIWNSWTQLSGTDLVTFVEGTQNQNVKMGAGAATLAANGYYNATPTITVSDYNTFTYSAPNAYAYYVSTSSTTPSIVSSSVSSTFALDTWTTATSTGNLSVVAGTYYVFVRGDGHVSSNKATVSAYTVTRSQGTGTTLTTKYGSSSGGAFTSNVAVLSGTPIYVAASLNTGYNTLVLTANGSSFTSGNTTTVTAATTIATSATANTYTVSYNANGGTGIPVSQTKTYGVTLTLSSTVPTRSGYTFLGWSTDSAATSATYAAGGSYMTNAPATLYAVWRLNQVNVTYDANIISGVNERTVCGVTVSYDYSTSNLTLNGTQTCEFDLALFEYKTFIEGEQYKINLTHISGGVTKNDNNTFTLDVRTPDITNMSSRNFKDVQYPENGINSNILTINNVGATEGGVLFLWMWVNSSGAVVFDNYVVKVTITKIETKTIDFNTNYVLPEQPTRIGYTFDGWYTSESGGTKVTSDTVMNVPNNHTLYAHWTLNTYTINYNLVYGLTDVSTTTSVNMTYSVSNGVVTVTATADDGYGYTNGRVYLEANKQYRFSITTTGTWGEWGDTVQAFLLLDGGYDTYYSMDTTDYTFTPTVSGEYWLRLDVNQSGKTYTFSDIRITSSTLSSQTKTYGNTLTLSNTIPLRSGYTFFGWSTDPSATSATYKDGGNYTTNANTTLYAVWNTSPYYSSVEVTNISSTGYDVYLYDVRSGNGISRVQFPTWTSNNGQDDLDGSWQTSSFSSGTNLGNGTWHYRVNIDDHKYEFGTYITHIYIYDTSGNTNTAVKQVTVPTPQTSSYTVSYNANGGSGAPAAQTKYHDISLTLSGTVPTRSGYTFLGWSTDSAATSATYAAGGSYTSNAAATLYAIWESTTTYLFTANNQHTDITGGWSSGVENGFSIYPFRGNGGSQSIGSTMNISWQRIPDTTRHGAAYYSTLKQIDLTNVKAIVIEATVSGYLNYAYAGVTTGIKPWNDSGYWNCSAQQKLVSGTTTLDVSSLSGSYYFMIGGSTESNLSSTGSIKATEIKLLY